jgi:hypothetical protein
MVSAEPPLITIHKKIFDSFMHVDISYNVCVISFHFLIIKNNHDDDEDDDDDDDGKHLSDSSEI